MFDDQIYAYTRKGDYRSEESNVARQSGFNRVQTERTLDMIDGWLENNVEISAWNALLEINRRMLVNTNPEGYIPAFDPESIVMHETCLFEPGKRRDFGVISGSNENGFRHPNMNKPILAETMFIFRTIDELFPVNGEIDPQFKTDEDILTALCNVEWLVRLLHIPGNGSGRSSDLFKYYIGQRINKGFLTSQDSYRKDERINKRNGLIRQTHIAFNKMCLEFLRITPKEDDDMFDLFTYLGKHFLDLDEVNILVLVNFAHKESLEKLASDFFLNFTKPLLPEVVELVADAKELLYLKFTHRSKSPNPYGDLLHVFEQKYKSTRSVLSLHSKLIRHIANNPDEFGFDEKKSVIVKAFDIFSYFNFIETGMRQFNLGVYKYYKERGSFERTPQKSDIADLRESSYLAIKGWENLIDLVGDVFGYVPLEIKIAKKIGELYYNIELGLKYPDVEAELEECVEMLQNIEFETIIPLEQILKILLQTATVAGTKNWGEEIEEATLVRRFKIIQKLAYSKEELMKLVGSKHIAQLVALEKSFEF